MKTNKILITIFALFLFQFTNSCKEAYEQEYISSNSIIPEKKQQSIIQQSVDFAVKNRDGFSFTELNDSYSIDLEMDVHEGYQELLNSPELASIFQNLAVSNSRVANSLPQINIDSALAFFQFSEQGYKYYDLIRAIEPDDSKIEYNDTIDYTEEEEIAIEKAIDDELNNVDKELGNLFGAIVADENLLHEERNHLLSMVDTYRNTYMGLFDTFQEIEDEVESGSNVRIQKRRKTGWLKRTWRRVRAVVVTAVVVTAVVVATITTGGVATVPAILAGKIIIGAAIAAQTINVIVNNECFGAFHCARGWCQDCDSGKCIPCLDGPNLDNNFYYGNGSNQQAESLTGPKSVGPSKYAPSSNCRGCKVSNYGKDIGSATIYITEIGDAPTFSTNGAVDMSNAPSGSPKNEMGWPRNQKYFWKNYSDPHNGLSNKNKIEIGKGKAPIVDQQWKRNMPGESNSILGEKIEHHHVNKGRYAVPRATSLHRSNKFFKKLHPKFTNSVVFKKSGAVWGRTGKTIIGTASIFAQVYDLVKATFTEDPNNVSNQITYYTDGGFMAEPFSGLKQNRLYWIIKEDAYLKVKEIERDSKGSVTYMAFTLYENYGYDASSKDYIGVGVITWGTVGFSRYSRKFTTASIEKH